MSPGALPYPGVAASAAVLERGEEARGPGRRRASHATPLRESLEGVLEGKMPAKFIREVSFLPMPTPPAWSLPDHRRRGLLLPRFLLRPSPHPVRFCPSSVIVLFFFQPITPPTNQPSAFQTVTPSFSSSCPACPARRPASRPPPPRFSTIIRGMLDA